jgi:hypothetical protein
MNRKLATIAGLAGTATLLLAFVAGAAAADPNGASGMGVMARDRDQLQMCDGSCDGTLPTDADRDQIRARDRAMLDTGAAGTGDQDRDRDRDRLHDGDCTQPCDNDGAQLRNRVQSEVTTEARAAAQVQTQERVRAER